MKITSLDLLADNAIDGTETLPVVKGGQSWRARLSALAAPMVAAASAARDAAQGLLGNTQAVAASLPFPYYATRAAAQGDGALAAGKVYVSNETGTMTMWRKDSASASTNLGAMPTTAYADRLKSRALSPTIDLGAVGSGASAVQDQAGFLAAINAAIASRNGLPTGTLDLFQYQNGIEIEPGIYDAGDFTMADCKSWLKARIPGTVFIRIPAGKYFLTVTGQLMSVYWDGIVFLGGKGAFRATSTANNANQQVRFTNCTFANYTECAISNNFGDSPFLKVDNSMFGGAGANCGIAWGGYIDQLVIENCAIGGNDYGIAIGPRLSGNYNIQKNDLLQNRKADIWIKPNTTDSGNINAGWAGIIKQNKFGNETQVSASPYPNILIANEDTASGADRATRTPLTTGAYDVGNLVMPTIKDNRFAHIFNWNAPIIRSYVSALRYGYWSNNKFDGGQATYVIEWPNGRTGADYSSNNSHFEFRDSDGNVPLQFSTHGFGRLYDYGAYWPGVAGSANVFPVSDSPLISPVVVALSGYDMGYGSGTVSVAAADPYGTNEYASVTGLVVSGFTDPYGGAGGPMFAEVALSKAAANTLSYVTIDIFNYANSGYAIKKTVPLPPNGSPARVCIPFILPANASPTTWQYRLYGSGIVSGSADTFVAGDMILSKGNGRLGRDKALDQSAVMPRNQRLIGGGIGALPTGWSMSGTPAGMTIAVTNVGTDQYGDFVEFSHTGTATASGGWVVRFEPQGAMIYAGSNYRCLLGVRLMSGSLSAATTATGRDGSTGPCTLQVGSYNSANSIMQQQGIAFTPTTNYAVYGRTLTAGGGYFNASAAYIWPLFNINYASGATANAVFRVYVPKFLRTK